MKYDLPCDIVQDLLPNYIDNLTAETTNESVKHHLQNCSNCNNAFKAMSSNDKYNQIDVDEAKILKMTKKRILKIICICIAAAVILSSIAFAFTEWLNTSDILGKDDVSVEVQKINAESITFSDTDKDENIIINFENSESELSINQENAEKIKEQGYLYHIIIKSDKSIDIVDEQYRDDSSIGIEIWSHHKSNFRKTKRLEYKMIYYNDITTIYNLLSEDKNNPEILWSNNE